MGRLIDVDEIKKREKDVVLANGAKHRCFDTTMLYELPTVDAVPVVRCKDCKWQITVYCPMPTWEQKDNHYCYKGERKEDG